MKKAFTLFEVLVVVLIVAILAGLLMPVASRAKNSAHTTACISNLRQIYVAMQLYRNDYGDYPVNMWSKPFDGVYLTARLHCSA